MADLIGNGPVVVEPVVNSRKLLELLDLQTEGPTVDYKELYDLRKDAPLRKRHLVELAKHVGAMSVQGGFLVVGVDDHGVPTGALSVEQADYFDEARLRPMLLTWLPKTLEIRSQKHEVDGKTVVLIYVARNPAGFAAFEADGQYGDGKKMTTLFTKGDIFWRDGTQSCRIDQRGLEQIIARAHTADASGVPLRASNLPSRTACFTGRDQLLLQLDSLIDDGPVCVVAIQGMGGVGKTQLVLEYAHRQYASGKYGIVWWVRAEHPVAMNEDLLALASRLDLDEDADVEAVLAELGRRSGWLLVYDNVTDPKLIERRLPPSGHVVLTSRSRGWSRYARPLDISLFTPFESVAFLYARTGRDESEAAELAEELGHLPLALAQAASYCEEHQLSIAGYLELFRSPRVRARLLKTGLRSSEYPDSVAKTWLLHFDHLRTHRPSALQLLRLCAFLQPDAIALTMILSRFELLPGPLASAANWLDDELAGIIERVSGVPFEAVEDVIGELANTGLITRISDDLVSVHRLVQAVTRQEMGSERSAAWRSYVDLLVHALHPYPPFPAAAQFEAALGWLRINGAHLAEQLRDGVSPDVPLPVRRLSALTDSPIRKPGLSQI